MPEPRYDFASDNTAGCGPEAWAALTEHNTGFASGYGTDTVTARAADLVRGLLDADADVRFVANGTAANCIALAALAQPHEAVLCHQHAHIATDETGAPGLFGAGVGLIPLPGGGGQIDPIALQATARAPDVSYRQSAAALSLTNATEYGTVYSAGDIRVLTNLAREAGLGVHLDGARLANAAAAGFDVKLLKSLNIDILIVGGTKAGMTPTEAVVLFNPALSRRFNARLKHAGQLTSKGRFLSAPWIGALESGAWLDRARHANAMAQRLAAIFRERTPFVVRHPVQANALFVEMEEAPLLRLRERGVFVYRFLDGTVRFMCSWATTEERVDALGEMLAAIC